MVCNAGRYLIRGPVVCPTSQDEIGDRVEESRTNRYRTLPDAIRAQASFIASARIISVPA